MPAIKLWASAGACSLAAHIILNDTGIPFEIVLARLEDGISDEVKRLNPKGRVPVLQLDDQIITENVAILTALAQLAPERNLLGKTNLEMIRSYEWMSYLSTAFHAQSFGGFFRPARFSDDESTYISIREKGRLNCLECLAFIEKSLNGLHAVGDQFTVVDAYLYVFWRWSCARVADMQTRFPKYHALVKELAKRESVGRTLEEEAIEGWLDE